VIDWASRKQPQKQETWLHSKFSKQVQATIRSPTSRQRPQQQQTQSSGNLGTTDVLQHLHAKK